MQISKVCYNNNFGAKFSPEFKNYLRESALYTYKDIECDETEKSNFDDNVQKLKTLFPDGTICIKEVNAKTKVKLNGLTAFNQKEPYVSVYMPSKQVVLCRKNKEDMLLGEAFFPYHTEIENLKNKLLELKSLETSRQKWAKSMEGIEIQKRIDKVIGN